MNDPVSSINEHLASPPDEQANMQIAFAAVLAARRETFLARYPRKFKLAVTAILVCLMLFPFMKGVMLSGPEEETQVNQSLAASPSLTHEATTAPPPRSTEPVELKTEAEKLAAATNDGVAGSPVHLEPAPDIALIEETPTGRLPKISADGRKPWQVYARPYSFQDPRPRIAIVMLDMGVSRVATDAALRRLPPPVTMVFDVQAPAVGDWLARARQDGHETLLSLPMEPFDYPRSDPGPNSLLTSLPNVDNIQRLLGALRSGAGYVGVTTSSGSRFLSDSPKLMPIMEVLKERGLMILDTKVAAHSAVTSLALEMGVPSAASSRELDTAADPTSIDAALLQLEQSARLEGAVVGIASPLPVTMERIEAWAKTLPERGIALAPLSAVVK